MIINVLGFAAEREETTAFAQDVVVTMTDGTNSTQFSADERVVLRVKNDEEETRIAAPKHHAASTGEAIFSTDGKRLRQIQRGVNIVRGNDGSVKKVLSK